MTRDNSTTPPTIKELIEGATSKPDWMPHDTATMADRRKQCAAQLIARCSPSVMREVVEALEAAKERAGQHRMTHYYETGGTTPCADEPLQAKLFRALSLLNATAKPEGKK
jgi:hypothetical protein